MNILNIVNNLIASNYFHFFASYNLQTGLKKFINEPFIIGVISGTNSRILIFN